MHTVDTIMSEMVELRQHIAPVGFEVDRIVIPAVRMRADKVWLIVHDNPAEDKAHKYRLKIEKELAKKGIKTQIARANRLILFPIIKAVKEIIIKERKNDIYVNVACGSKIHAIGCMMACMIFDKREHIHPFYAQADKYPEYDGRVQQTYGVKEIHRLPTYRIGTPRPELLKAMKIIKKAGGRIQKKKMAEEAEKNDLITVNAQQENFTQARLKLTDDGEKATEFLI